MKKSTQQSLLLLGAQLILWIISFYFWYFVMNHGIKSNFEVDGLEIGTSVVLLSNLAFLTLILLPFAWLVKWFKCRTKWIFTLLFVLFGFAIAIGLMRPGEQFSLLLLAAVFVQNSLYVIVFHITLVAVVYLNRYRLIEQYLAKSRFGHYILWVILLAVAGAVTNYSLFNLVIDQLFPSLFYISSYKIVELIGIMAAYLIITTAFYLVWQYRNMLILQKEAANHELLALKAQINPHFLFNNLNTIYSLADKNDPHTKEVILQLSDFLRYILYDTSSEAIPLEKEAEIIRTYIDLQRERIATDRHPVTFYESGNYGRLTIAPLLLLPLVENCFKHGLGQGGGSITIGLKVEGSRLLFDTQNKIALRENGPLPNGGGLGIKNIEKRLHLLYPNRFRLTFPQQEGEFVARLEIELQPK